MAPSMPCKTSKKSQHGVSRGKSNEIKSKLACILDASETTILRIGESLSSWRVHCRKGDKSLHHFNLVHKYITVATSHEKSSSGWGMGKLVKIPAWNQMKVRSKNEVIDEARTKGAKVQFASLMGICHLKNAELETKAPKIEKLTPHQQWQLQNQGYHFQTARVRRISSWCSICWYTGKNGRYSKITSFSKVRMSRHFDSSTTTQMTQNKAQYGRSSRSSWSKFVYFWQDYYWKGNLKKNPIEVRLGEGFQLGKLFRTPWKGLLISVFVDDIF